MKGFQKTKSIAPIIVSIVICSIIFISHITTDPNEQIIINLDNRLDYYADFSFAELDQYCSLINLFPNLNLHNRNICECNEFKNGRKPKWFNLPDIRSYKKDYNQYLNYNNWEMIPITNIEKEYKDKMSQDHINEVSPLLIKALLKNFELKHKITNELIRLDNYHNSLKPYMVYSIQLDSGEIRIVDLSDEFELFKTKIKKLENQIKGLKLHIGNLIKGNKNIEIEKNKLYNLEVILNETNLELKKITDYYEKYKNVFYKLNPHYHRVLGKRELDLINLNKCGDIKLSRDEEEHQIFGWIE